MILSGKEIRRRMLTEKPDIKIDPYDPSNLNPNSYNVTLHHIIEIAKGSKIPHSNKIDPILDMKKETSLHSIDLYHHPQGYTLYPDTLYLARTNEHTETHNLIPMIEGRSSIGRLGIFVHITAGFGDVGFIGFWTLELSVVQPIRIYPDVAIAQIFYHTIEGDFDEYIKGKYQRNKGIQPSLLYKELQ